ncbi:hypothetical protein GUJ93_ZPchr0005g15013 [Zizania palustris]|uniref:Uncharacterized protein n=1 Tax=Zizania palustris TaxID=103762 RepID=A0A8J5W1P8_ZIZPA|nr:hypothetical protein GUJ93_ZPchr0005g15013 [Zizania palustris]
MPSRYSADPRPPPHLPTSTPSHYSIDLRPPLSLAPPFDVVPHSPLCPPVSTFTLMSCLSPCPPFHYHTLHRRTLPTEDLAPKEFMLLPDSEDEQENLTPDDITLLPACGCYDGVHDEMLKKLNNIQEKKESDNGAEIDIAKEAIASANNHASQVICKGS